MKFCTGILYKNLSSKLEFHEKEVSECHALRNGINERLPYFVHFFV